MSPLTKAFFAFPALALAACAARGDAVPLAPEEPAFHELSAATLAGGEQDFAQWAGRPVLVVNVASHCGYTPQYEGLQALWEEYRDRGLVVVGFPCNQFLGQEPGAPEEILAFCRDEYGVDFPLMAKVAVKGEEQSPVYAWLQRRTGETPAWNFGKYLVSPDGRSARFFGTRTEPSDPELRAAIEAALGAR